MVIDVLDNLRADRISVVESVQWIDSDPRLAAILPAKFKLELDVFRRNVIGLVGWIFQLMFMNNLFLYLTKNARIGVKAHAFELDCLI